MNIMVRTARERWHNSVATNPRTGDVKEKLEEIYTREEIMRRQRSGT